MTDILSIIQGSNAHVRLEVSGEDLLAFSNYLINRAKDELTTIVEESRKERFLSKENNYVESVMLPYGIGERRTI